eukprot:4727696-Prorocentrum_lima.AAC.1
MNDLFVGDARSSPGHSPAFDSVQEGRSCTRQLKDSNRNAVGHIANNPGNASEAKCLSRVGVD